MLDFLFFFAAAYLSVGFLINTIWLTLLYWELSHRTIWFSFLRRGKVLAFYRLHPTLVSVLFYSGLTFFYPLIFWRIMTGGKDATPAAE